MSVKINPEEFSIVRVSFATYAGFIKNYHYAKGCNEGGIGFGLIYKEKYIVGVCIFATSISEEARAWPFGEEHAHRVTELHRLSIIGKDKWAQRPDHLLSWFTSRCLKLILEDKPETRAVLSFSDKTEGHKGIIYRALNAMYFGETGRTRKYYKDNDGRLISPRRNGKNISEDEAIAKGWVVTIRDRKHKYLWVIGPTVAERKLWKKNLLHKPVKWKVKKNE